MENSSVAPPPSSESHVSNLTASFSTGEGRNYGAQTGHNYGIINVRTAETTDTLLKNLQRVLYRTDPDYDLQSILRNKGTVVPGTCRWLLNHPKYRDWLNSDLPSMLRVVGSPGVGKTMLSSYLVRSIAKDVDGVHDSMFAYYFCDNKQQDRRTTTSVLCSIALQMLRQNHKLKSYLKDPFELMGEKLRDNVDALWTFVRQAVTNPDVKVVFLLIDALDELIPSCRSEISTLLRQLFNETDCEATGLKLRLLITHRPEPEFSPYLERFSTQIELSAQTTESDVALFIESRVNDLTEMKRYPTKLSKDIRDRLGNNANGTFLWASLILEDLEHLQANDRVRSRLNRVPQTLNETYDRVLHNIPAEIADRAARLLQIMVVATRPLTRTEISIVCFVAEAMHGHPDAESPVLSSFDDDGLAELIDCYTCCGAMVFLDLESDTINLVHQSAKDYLTSSYLKQHGSLSEYYTDTNKSNFVLFEILVFYMDLMQSVHGYMIFQRHFHDCIVISKSLHRVDDLDVVEDANDAKGADMDTNPISESPSRAKQLDPPMCHLIDYAVDQYYDHASAAEKEFHIQNIISRGMNQCRPILGCLLINAARNGLIEIVRQLLRSDSVPVAQMNEGESAIHAAIKSGHTEAIRLLLHDGRCEMMKDVEGQTALHAAVNSDADNVVLQIGRHRHGLLLEEKDLHGRSPLHIAVIRCIWRPESRTIVKILMQLGCDPNATSLDGQTPLSFASRYEIADVIELLNSKDALTSQDDTHYLTQQTSPRRAGLFAERDSESDAVLKNLFDQEVADVERHLQTCVVLYLYTNNRTFIVDGLRLHFMLVFNCPETDPEKTKRILVVLQDEVMFYCQCVASRLRNQREDISVVLFVREWARFRRAMITFAGISKSLDIRFKDLEQENRNAARGFNAVAMGIWKRTVFGPMKDKLAKISKEQLRSWVRCGICETEEMDDLGSMIWNVPGPVKVQTVTTLDTSMFTNYMYSMSISK